MKTNAQVALELAVKVSNTDKFGFDRRKWEEIQANASNFLDWLRKHDGD